MTTSNQRRNRELPPAAAGVKLDKGAVPAEASQASPEALETPGVSNGARVGLNGDQAATQGRPEGDWSFDDEEPQHPQASNRAKADTTRSVGRGRQRSASPTAAPQLSKADRDDWRWRLRSMSGKLHAAESALDEAADRWERLVANAREAGVPHTMLLVALMDAGIEEPERYL
ncbi:hypothetical protein ACQP10_38010 (plasmid) [Streptosporangium sandarakinum]|uniref:hypothetical protein n=1 Tax=Streptosporangium sandarakinum TaxID=1260955 RepID=UPI003D8AB929